MSGTNRDRLEIIKYDFSNRDERKKNFCLPVEDYEWLIEQANLNTEREDGFWGRLAARQMSKINRLTEALEFYADFYKYNYGGDTEAMKQVSKSEITNDGGNKARQALIRIILQFDKV